MLASLWRAVRPARKTAPAAARRARRRPAFERLEDRTTPSGNLDLGFSGDGRQTLNFVSDDRASAVAVQADGKIVVAGSNSIGGNGNFAVARYLADGTLDPSFSGDGKTDVTFGAEDVATAVAIQGDGKIVVAGYTSVNGTAGNPNDFAVARLNADGSLDTTFNDIAAATISNGDGKLTIDFGADDRCRAMVINVDGKIVLAGSQDNGFSNFAVARLTSAGAPDPDFGGGDGKVIETFGGKEYATAVAIQFQRIIVAGYTDVGGTASNPNDFAVACFDNTGTIDTSFDNDGWQTFDFGSDDRANAVAVQTDGRIVLAGSWDGGFSDFAVVRLTAAGAVDTGFSPDGTAGAANFTFGGAGFGGAEFATSVAIQKDGKILVGGYTDNGNLGGLN